VTNDFFDRTSAWRDCDGVFRRSPALRWLVLGLLLPLVFGCDLGGGRIAYDRAWLTNLVTVGPDGRMTLFDPQRLEKKEYLLFFLGSHNDPKTLNMTPKLVSVYLKLQARNPSFEVVFVPRDEDERNMVRLMQQTGMPWPAVRVAATQAMPEVLAAAGDQPVGLLLVDSKGRILANSNDRQDYSGPQLVIEELESRLGVEDNTQSVVEAESSIGKAREKTQTVIDQIQKQRDEHPDIYGR